MHHIVIRRSPEHRAQPYPVPRTPHASAAPNGAACVWTPPADVFEDELSFQILVEVPGIASNCIDITTERGLLTVVADRTAPEADGNKPTTGAGASAKTLRKELRTGHLKRGFVLPKNADTANIKAHCENGILTVLIPKLAKTAPRKVPIDSTVQ
ncbi:MAG: Hsp20/alpha crystallin family protein [Pseudomonadota bacterium]|nr:Hsp20/alpha crystallin family protein [Pseudomonadota bacterium]